MKPSAIVVTLDFALKANFEISLWIGLERVHIGWGVNKREILQVQATMAAVGVELCQHIQELRAGPTNRSLNVSSVTWRTV